MEAEIQIDHPDLAYLGVTIATHDPETDLPISHCIARAKVWEGFQTRQLLALISNPDFRSFYDLGANIGWHSLTAAAHLRAHGLQGHIVAVEPARTNRARFERSIALNGLEGRVQLVAGAVSDHNGQARLDHDPVNAGNHHLSGFSWPSETYVTSEEVAIYRLDDLVHSKGWPLPTLIKIDVQGHEPPALAGFGDMLETVPDWIMAIEFTPDFWSLDALIAQLCPDGVYQQDEQSRAVVPTSPERLRSIAAEWPRKYYDLILTRGPKAEQAIAALPEYCGTVQMRFTKGFGGLTEHGTRWAEQLAEAVLEPLQPGTASREIEVAGEILRRPWDGVVVLFVEDGTGQRQRLPLKIKTPFSFRCRVGPGPVHLRFELREKPDGQRRHPSYAFQVSHLELSEVQDSPFDLL